MVVGGSANDHAEIMVDFLTRWITIASLPSGRMFFSAATLDNSVSVFGK